LISDFDRNSNEVVGQLNPNGVNAHNVWRMYHRKRSNKKKDSEVAYLVEIGEGSGKE
jgi:hypothetical protein